MLQFIFLTPSMNEALSALMDRSPYSCFGCKTLVLPPVYHLHDLYLNYDKMTLTLSKRESPQKVLYHRPGTVTVTYVAGSLIILTTSGESFLVEYLRDQQRYIEHPISVALDRYEWKWHSCFYNK